MDNQDYLKRGYTEYFERDLGTKKIPYLNSFDMDSYIENIPGGLLSGGIIMSKDGKLKINLEEGTITYSDGVTTTTLI